MSQLRFLPIVIFFGVLLLVANNSIHTARADTPTPTSIPVVFVPGIGGSRLADSQNVEYWTAAGYTGHDLLTLYPSQLHPTLYATNAITEATFLGFHIPSEDWQTYGPVIAYLQSQGFVLYQTNQDPARQTSAGCDVSQASNNPNLFVFAYDWRISNAANAVLLADYIACVQKFYPNTNINLLAHSMGGLVARRYIIDNPGTHHVNALVSVGSPYVGASKALWAEETGEFVFFVWASTLLDVVGSFNGASELINSQAWYDLGGKPALIENGQDLNGDGHDNEQFTYPMLVQYLDTAKGKEGFLPGTANQTFHSYTNAGNAQDDWRNDTTGVKYFHIVGAGLVPDTINQVVAGSLWQCVKNYSICNLATWMYPKFAQGDETVPLLSASRIGPTLNLNAPNATVYTCESFSANNRNVDHSGMLSNPVVQGLLVQFLVQANGGAAQPTPPSLACGQGQTALAAKGIIERYHQLVLQGVKDVKVSDGTADPFPDTVALYNTGDKTSVLTLGSGKTYTVSFRATRDLLYLEWLYRDAKKPSRAVRFRDISMVPNTLAELTVQNGKLVSLNYDADNDGLVETRVVPTVELQGAQARDLRPPRVKFSVRPQGASRIVSISAKDKGTGVANVVYSLDGRHFQIYTKPFSVGASVKVIYAFADDLAGNRTHPLRFRVK